MYTVGLGDSASFDPMTKVAALLQIRAILLSFEPYRVRALDNRKLALQLVLRYNHYYIIVSESGSSEYTKCYW